MKRKISITVDDKLLKGVDHLVDNLIIRNRSQAIEHLLAKGLNENRIAVILSGGREKDLRISSSEYRITAMLNKRTLVEEAIYKLKEDNFRTIFIVACKKILADVFSLVGDGSSFGVKINYVEDNNPKGSAASLSLLKGKINSDFLVVYGDILFKQINIEELWNDYIGKKPVSTLMLTSSPTPSKKGIVKVEGSKILDFMQKPKKSDIYIGFSSIFAANPEIFEIYGNSLERNVFPSLAVSGLLNGHISSEKEVHIHNKKDVFRVVKK